MFCKLTPEEEVRMHLLLRGVADDPTAQEMKKFIQHGSVTTYEHCMRVTRIAFWLNIHLRVHADEKSLVKGAFLHDFYLYDWHENDRSHRLHGYHHPERSCANAVAYFQIGELVQQMIRTHMWPLTITKLPRSREAWILCLVDKYISTEETFAMRKRG